jgi:hypothetical protein
VVAWKVCCTQAAICRAASLPPCGGAEPAAADEPVDPALGDVALELLEGGRRVAAVEAADGHDGLAGADPHLQRAEHTDAHVTGHAGHSAASAAAPRWSTMAAGDRGPRG